jgi:DNA-binding NtrC family response regulator
LAVAPPRRVLLLVEDPTLMELLLEALAEAGHHAEGWDEGETLESALLRKPFDVALIDLDTRAHNGRALIARLRSAAPTIGCVALLPCGGLFDGAFGYQLALEKPARLQAIVRAVESTAA